MSVPKYMTDIRGYLQKLAQHENIDIEKATANLASQIESENKALAATPKKRFKKLDVELGMYQDAARDGVSLTQFLEKEDPSGMYPGTKLDAFQRQLAARGLAVSGRNAVTLDQFYDDPNSRVLFPEFINREVQVGLLLGRHTLKDDDVIATETVIDSGTYDAAIATMSSAPSMAYVGQGADMPVVTITIADKSVKLQKIGLYIRETYEHRRRIRVNKMAIFLRLIGWRMALDKAEHAVDILVNGNSGNSNGAFTFAQTTLNYNGLVDFWAEWEPYESEVLVFTKTGLTTLLKLAEFKDSRIAAPWLLQGTLMTPLGHQMKRHNGNGTLLTNKVLGVDTNFAVERVIERGSMLTETDKLIRGQWNEIAISMVVGYAKIIAEAAGVWNYA